MGETRRRGSRLAIRSVEGPGEPNERETMRMSTRRRRRFAFWMLGLAAVLGIPSLAHAQLFPDLQIRRQRPCCNQEDPRYHMVREVYFGYYPTCWRQFPEGWGCYPKTGMPDWAAELTERPIEPINDYYAAGEGGVGVPPSVRHGNYPAAPGRGDNVPPPEAGLPLPEERGSLFDSDNTLRPPGGVMNPPSGVPETTPSPAPSLPGGPGDLFNPAPSGPTPRDRDDDLFNPAPSGTTPPDAGAEADAGAGAGAVADETPTPSGLPRTGSSAPAPTEELSLTEPAGPTEAVPSAEPPALGSDSQPSTGPEVLLEGELPQAPPLGPPGSIASPVSSNVMPAPSAVPVPVQVPPRSNLPASVSNPPRRGGFLANLFGRTRKR